MIGDGERARPRGVRGGLGMIADRYETVVSVPMPTSSAQTTGRAIEGSSVSCTTRSLDSIWSTPGAVERALDLLGLRPKRLGGRFTALCPACSQPRAYCYETDGSAPAVRCNRRNHCGFHSTLFALLAQRLGDNRRALEWLRGAPTPPRAAGASLVARSPKGRRPPQHEVESLWRACVPISRPTLGDDTCPDHPAGPAVHALLRSRGSNPDDVGAFDIARLAPVVGPTFDWWPPGWSRRWPIIVPAFEADGCLASLHARSAAPSGRDTKRWPKGYESRRLIFASAAGRALLAGDSQIATELDLVLIAEGLTDFVAACLYALRRRNTAGDRWAVLGVTAGGACAFEDVSWPRSLAGCVITDADPAGDAYASAIRHALPHLRLTRRSSHGGGAQ